jgi:hypothetical protein
MDRAAGIPTLLAAKPQVSGTVRILLADGSKPEVVREALNRIVRTGRPKELKATVTGIERSDARAVLPHDSPVATALRDFAQPVVRRAPTPDVDEEPTGPSSLADILAPLASPGAAE